MLSDFWPMFTSRDTLPAAGFKVDISEGDDSYTVYAEMPGVPKEAISVDLRDGVMTIDVTRDESEENQEGGFIHRERRASSMQRSLYLKNAATEGASAAMDNGILTITVPKAVKTPKTSKIDIL
jgi:HSP20 family protein